MKKFILLLNVILIGVAATAQYNQYDAFTPLLYSKNGNEYRSASGQPSAQYWQNKADYTIKASFDTLSKVLSGDMVLDYTNNSPDKLNCLWLEMIQNANVDSSIGNILNNNIKRTHQTGFEISALYLEEGNTKTNLKFQILDTRMQVRLPKIVMPHNKIKLHIIYKYVLYPSSGGDRSGYNSFANGSIYEFSYWYPRVCVYDDIRGWNTLPFVGGGEMYLDYGDVDYTLRLPYNMLVSTNGDLLNKKEILSSKICQRLDNALNSDSTVMIRSAADLDNSFARAKSGMVDWHFNMKNTRDVAWAISASFIWDAARMQLPDGHFALAQSFYPKEALLNGRAWGRATQFLKFSIEQFSRLWFSYPYATATNVAGGTGGMEFPGLGFDDWDAKPYDMFLLASHEIGHTWFPMIVGSDERRFAFMDEGFNTFIDIFAHDEFNHGEFAPKRDGEYAKGKGNPADEVAQVIAQYADGPTLMTAADAQNYASVHPLDYFKSAYGLVLLRDVILGRERFDYSFRQYIQDWSFKHPQPEDFFRSIESNGGEDLGWFWKGWYYNNWRTDLAVGEVHFDQNDSSKIVTMTIENKGKMPWPVTVELKDKNGKHTNVQLPVEIWQRGSKWTFKTIVDAPIVEIQLDPQKRLPDENRKNDYWHS